MRQKQSQFSEGQIVEKSTHDENGAEKLECAMCRETQADCDDPMVAIGYCAAGNAIGWTSPPGVCIASPSSPYVNACMHSVHLSCWKKHCESVALRSQRGDVFLLRQESGEVQCPVCRTLANIAIPVLPEGSNAVSDRVFEAIVDVAESILSVAKQHAEPSHGVSDLWLSRSRKFARPIIFSPTSDALAEAAFNEVLLSVALSPLKILSSTSLHAMLIRCFRASFKSTTCVQAGAWNMWESANASVDCARMFLESTCYENKEFMMKLLALRHVQLAGDAGDSDYDVQMAHLAVFIAWVFAAVYPLSSADVNRIGYLPEDPKGRLNVVEQVLGIGGWRGLVRDISVNPALKMPHAIGGLVEFIKLPEKLTDLIRETMKRSCEKCKSKPQDPAICLLCGAVLCLDSDCCKGPEGEGECTQHAEKCGAGQGVFILPYASIVVAVASPRNCIWDGPYEDSHGEPDSYMKRSCKLTLSQRRLDQMRLLYTRGCIAIEIVKQNQITGRYVPRQL
jgi:hypothetical protein